MPEAVSIVLAGLGGYGQEYLKALLEQRDDARFRLAGGVDPSPRRCNRLAELNARGVPIYRSLQEFYRAATADLAVLSSPIHRHCSQTCLALAHGSHVLCEKPVAATVQDVNRMIRARDRAGKHVAIGYQWSFSTPIQRLKQDILAGHFGAPRRLRSLCLWPRDEVYYHRNTWAGRLRDARGAWVLDSPANNAMAHDLHNMLYLLGPRTEASAQPVALIAELYRANDIENFDTAALRVHTDGGAEILFYGSHAVPEDSGPEFCFEFEHATVTYTTGHSPIVARFSDGATRHYGGPNDEPQVTKLWTCLAALAGAGTIPCGLEAARAQTLCANGAQDSAGAPVDFPRELVHVKGESPKRLTWVAGLDDVLRRCYAAGVLPSEAQVAWARAGRRIDLRGYRRFPGGAYGQRGAVSS
ncbi:MAG TPA: Gfo/Idh/MocA family oxidoreductase [Phycisphaerae bacterium]|nr:Gfo/Idh/MocA family oxidoreductase [Phycisphaerae bacterium]HNU45082.1 Gfo/Idh/MocA family oxidoreductase [Phycisphaerae bacterium]